LPVAPHIGNDSLESFGQKWHLITPGMMSLRKTMQAKAERPLPRCYAMKPDAIGFDENTFTLHFLSFIRH